MPDILDAALLRRWAHLALDALARARQEIDALNVYPVPDGDTGTNLFLTWEGAAEAVDATDESTAEAAGAEATGRALARGALLGARGNSGVILSQMLRGAAAELGPAPTAERLQAALRQAATSGYEAVAHPVEGTMLTVMRAAAEAAGDAALRSLGEVAMAASAGARAALERTPEQLEVLRRAGVVDAGGRGLTVVLDALAAAITGTAMPSGGPAGPHPLAAHVEDIPLTGPAFEVMYLLDAADEVVPALRRTLDGLGDSLLLVGGDGLWNVHVHTDDVGAAIEAGVVAGRPYRIRVTHFGDQRQPRTAVASRTVVAVAAGEDLAMLLAEHGATVVRHAAGVRPSTRDLLAAMRAGEAAEVVVLPDDRDTVGVAEAAAAEARAGGARVVVLPSSSPLQVISALAVHDPTSSLDDAVVTMTAASRGTRTGAVTTAVRESLTTAGVCRPGDVLGMVADEVVVIGADVPTVAVDVVERMLSLGGELVTVLLGGASRSDSGDPQSDAVVRAVSDHLRNAHPEVDLEVLSGGQPHYPVLLGVE